MMQIPRTAQQLYSQAGQSAVDKWCRFNRHTGSFKRLNLYSHMLFGRTFLFFRHIIQDNNACCYNLHSNSLSFSSFFCDKSARSWGGDIFVPENSADWRLDFRRDISQHFLPRYLSDMFDCPTCPTIVPFRQPNSSTYEGSRSVVWLIADPVWWNVAGTPNCTGVL